MTEKKTFFSQIALPKRRLFIITILLICICAAILLSYLSMVQLRSASQSHGQGQSQGQGQNKATQFLLIESAEKTVDNLFDTDDNKELAYMKDDTIIVFAHAQATLIVDIDKQIPLAERIGIAQVMFDDQQIAVDSIADLYSGDNPRDDVSRKELAEARQCLKKVTNRKMYAELETKLKVVSDQLARQASDDEDDSHEFVTQDDTALGLSFNTENAGRTPIYGDDHSRPIYDYIPIFETVAYTSTQLTVNCGCGAVWSDDAFVWERDRPGHENHNGWWYGSTPVTTWEEVMVGNTPVIIGYEQKIIGWR